MALNFVSIIKLISKSSTVASTANSLIKKYKEIKSTGTENTEDIMRLQAEINEKLEKQINYLEKTVHQLHKTIQTLTIVVIITFFITIISIILWMVK